MLANARATERTGLQQAAEVLPEGLLLVSEFDEEEEVERGEEGWEEEGEDGGEEREEEEVVEEDEVGDSGSLEREGQYNVPSTIVGLGDDGSFVAAAAFSFFSLSLSLSLLSFLFCRSFRFFHLFFLRCRWRSRRSSLSLSACASTMAAHEAQRDEASRNAVISPKAVCVVLFREGKEGERGGGGHKGGRTRNTR